jgi:hypothetical protein
VEEEEAEAIAADATDTEADEMAGVMIGVRSVTAIDVANPSFPTTFIPTFIPCMLYPTTLMLVPKPTIPTPRPTPTPIFGMPNPPPPPPPTPLTPPPLIVPTLTPPIPVPSTALHTTTPPIFMFMFMFPPALFPPAVVVLLLLLLVNAIACAPACAAMRVQRVATMWLNCRRRERSAELWRLVERMGGCLMRVCEVRRGEMREGERKESSRKKQEAA